MNNQQKKLNNKGFSLVELIIVIGIMAILAGAMAPQLMKYLEKARVSTDTSNINSLKTATETALADEKAFNSLPETGDLVITIENNGGSPKVTYAPDTANDFKTELQSIITSWPTAKAKSKTGFKITINETTRKVTVVTTEK